MDFAHIKSLLDGDYPKLDKNILSVASLARTGFTTAEGLVIFKRSKEVEDLLKKYKLYYLPFHGPSGWGEIFKKVEGIWKNFKDPLPVFFLPKESSFIIKAFRDLESGEIKIQTPSNTKLSPIDEEKIVNKVVEADKKLFIPHTYFFIKAKEFLLIKILPTTSHVERKIQNPKFKETITQESLKALKIFHKSPSKIEELEKSDGIFINIDLNSSDQKLYEMIKLCNKISPKIVICKILSENLKVLNFLLNKNVPNLEFISNSIKKPYKHWIEIDSPVQLLEIENVFEANLCGVILNLDSISNNLYGEADPNYQVLKEFITPHLLKIHRSKVPVLVDGDLIHKEDLLEFLIEGGIYGITSRNVSDLFALPGYIGWLEGRVVSRRTHEI